MKMSVLVGLVLALVVSSQSKSVKRPKGDVCIGCIEPYTGSWSPIIDEVEDNIHVLIKEVLQIYSQIVSGVKYYVVFRSRRDKICIGTYVSIEDTNKDFTIRCMDMI